MTIKFSKREKRVVRKTLKWFYGHRTHFIISLFVVNVAVFAAASAESKLNDTCADVPENTIVSAYEDGNDYYVKTCHQIDDDSYELVEKNISFEGYKMALRGEVSIY